ncbi:hypothetical protein BW687_011165 [Pseudomonas graminis]|uniref:hypothetical protein n=1 Tax=Pseudomonas graminis TaxID=158627 RepID=UPI00234AFDC6|nr:hypothetical protein [Pseudomonas graminis]MDC6380734.1 hypothetical protein [Pseudomonas graminis]
MDKSAEHDIVLDSEYVGAMEAGGSHWRLRLILKKGIIQDCVRRGNAGLAGAVLFTKTGFSREETGLDTLNLRCDVKCLPG